MGLEIVVQLPIGTQVNVDQLLDLYIYQVLASWSTSMTSRLAFGLWALTAQETHGPKAASLDYQTPEVFK